ncbi:MAG: polymer-forming cytoskeletal protein [Pseudomonadota bacterium]
MGRKKQDTGITLISPSSRVRGDVHFSEQLFVNGRIEGNLYAEPDSGSTVVISEQGAVSGEIRVPNVVINGLVEGDVYAAGKLELAAKAKVTGNVYYKLIEMQLGAKVDGQLVHEDVASAAPAAGSGPSPTAAAAASAAQANDDQFEATPERSAQG